MSALNGTEHTIKGNIKLILKRYGKYGGVAQSDSSQNHPPRNKGSCVQKWLPYLLKYKLTSCISRPPHFQGKKSDFSSFRGKQMKFTPIEISQKVATGIHYNTHQTNGTLQAATTGRGCILIEQNATQNYQTNF